MPNPLVRETVIATAKTACCAVIGLAGGHFGMLFLGALGAAGTVAASDPIRKTLELATEKASEIAAEVGIVALAEREPDDPLERIFQSALRQSFQQIRSALSSHSVAGDRALTSEMIDFLDNCDRALETVAVNEFDKILIISPTDEESDRCLREALTLLNAQGRRLDPRRKHESTDRIITYRPDELEEPPQALVGLLKDHLPNVLPPIFFDLLTADKNNRANKLYVNNFIVSFTRVYGPTIQRIEATVLSMKEETALLPGMNVQIGKIYEHILGIKQGLGPAQKPFNLPFATLGNLFKGREGDMNALSEQLKKKGATAIVQPASITGMGGIGKTQLAIEYALRHESEFSALLFVTANTPEELANNFSLLSGPEVLNLAAYLSGRQPEQHGAVLQWLQANTGWLLIFDNADTKGAATAVRQLVPKLAGGQVLITSRISEWGGSVHAMGLDLLSEEASVSYLIERTAAGRQRQPGEESEALALADELGGLALALEQAAAYVNARGMSLAEYRRRWRESNEKLIDYRDEFATQYPKSVAVTFLTSFEQLSPNARRLLNILAWLAPDPIPLSLLEIDGGPFAAENPDSVPENQRQEKTEEAEEALTDLARFSLATRSADKAAFSVHRLVQAVARRNQHDDERHRSVATALRWVNSGFTGSPQDVRFWPVLEPLAVHARAVADEADRRSIPEPTARLMNQLGLFYDSRAEWSLAEPMYRRALAIDEQSYGPDHPEVATDLNNLAELLRATNRLAEAEPMYRRALSIDEQSYGPDHPNVATDLNNLAGLLRATNRLAEAEPMYRRVLAIDEQSYGPDHPKVATRLNNLAGLLGATNRLAEAEPMFRRALAIDEQSYGPDHPNVARDLNNLALLLEATDRLDEAEPMYRRVASIFEKSLGPDHPNVATALNNLAGLLGSTNRLTEAEPMYRRALAIDEQSYGPDHPNVATRLNNLAGLLRATNRLTEAEPMYRRALAIDEKSYGPDHPNVAIRLSNLAELLWATNRLAEAEPMFRRALAIDEQSYGPDHPEVAIRLNNLAGLLRATNRLAEAEPMNRRVVSILGSFTRDTGHRHPHLRGAVSNYAGLLGAMGLNQEQIRTKLREMAPEFFE